MAGRRRHVDDGQPVRPTAWKNYPKVKGGDVWEVDEEDGDVSGYKAEERNRDGEDHEGEAEEEGLIPKTKKVVTQPTAEEIEQHMVTHTSPSGTGVPIALRARARLTRTSKEVRETGQYRR